MRLFNILKNMAKAIGKAISQDEYKDIISKASLIEAEEATNKTVTAYYVEYAVNLKNLSRFELKADQTYTLRANVTSSVSGFYCDVGRGNGSYEGTISNVKRSYSGGVYTMTFTPSSADLANGNIFCFRLPRYGSSQSFTYSISNVTLSYGTDEITTYDILQDLSDALLNKQQDSLLQSYTSTNASPAVITLTSSFNAMIILGFFQGIGNLFLGVSFVNDTVSINNLLTGASYSSQYLTITKSGTTVTITTYSSSRSFFTAILGG